MIKYYKKSGLFFLAVLMFSLVGWSQNRSSVWTKVTHSKAATEQQRFRKSQPMAAEYYQLNLNALKAQLHNAPNRSDAGALSNVVLDFPGRDGKFDSYRIYEAPVLHADLQAQFPDMRSYIGSSLNNPSDIIRFSVTPQGLHSMLLSPGNGTQFIDPFTVNGNYYAVYAKRDLPQLDTPFVCEFIDDEIVDRMEDFDLDAARNANDGTLRTYRLAIATTIEYSAFHVGIAGVSGGTLAEKKAAVLDAITVTMTRVNGVYEKDLSLTMVLVPNNLDIIFIDSDSFNNTNATVLINQSQTVIDATIGSANYDIGHTFSTGGGGLAQLNSPCVAGSKARGITGSSAPIGDPYDIDYVAHEMGHQFGSNHTFNGSAGNCSGTNRSAANAYEPGSGSTIMAYAGICGTQNVQSNSDAYFHQRSLVTIWANISSGASSTCPTSASTGNAVPTAEAGANYTIPISTPYALTASSTDADGIASHTYTWEQYDLGPAGVPTQTTATGPLVRSFEGTTNPTRYIPRLQDLVTVNGSTDWEKLVSVSRAINYRVTVRDNDVRGGQTAVDDMTVTVTNTAGPFIVTAPNTNVTWSAGSTQTVTWDVAGTTASPISCANVDIFLSTDDGYTYPITLLANTPNDGSQSITVPNTPGTQNRIMVKASNNIFFDISNTNFTISGPCVANIPTGLAVTGIGGTSATLNWDEVYSSTYDVRYREVGSSTWITIATSNFSLELTNLEPLTNYEAQVRSKCAEGGNSDYSDSIFFITTNISYCSSNGNDTSDEYIGRVQLNTLDNNNSGPGTSGTGYSDFSSNPSLTTDLVAGTQYSITITPVWTGTTYPEGYAVWIDYNHDGDFNDTGEMVWSSSATTNTPVTGNFTVPENIAYYGPTRMRVSMKYNAIPTSCESFNYGEVEDYTINLMYDGLLFANNIWTPNAPSELTSGANALVMNGTFNLNDDIALNNLTINSGAEMNVLQGQSVELNGNLTSNGNFILNSSSNQYASLIANGTVSGNVKYLRHVNINASSGGNDLISAPLTGQTFGAFAAENTNIVSNPNNASEKLFGHFDKITGTYQTYDTDLPSDASILLSAGIGYRAASTDNGTFAFEGNVNTGIVNVNISNTGPSYAEWNLIGNPYPSYIKLFDFLSANINEFLPSSAAIYGYDGNAADGWKILNLAYATANPNAIITPGQGFFVSSKVGGGTVVFNPSFRTIASGNALLDDDFIEGREVVDGDIAHLNLSMTSASNSFKTDFYFTNNASKGLDIGYDAIVFNGVAPGFAIYSRLVEENAGNDIAIQTFGFDDLDDNLTIPIGVNASLGQQITIGMPTNTLTNGIGVYLEDRSNNTFTMLNTNDYVFTADSNLSGVGRFYLRFDTSALGLDQNGFESLVVYATLTPKQIVINGLLSETTKATVYDVRGRQMMAMPLIENVARQVIDINNLSSGFYVLKIQGKNGVLSQKIVVK